MLSHDAFLAAISRNLLSGTFAPITDSFDYPAAIYVEDRVVVVHDEGRLRGILEEYRALLLELGVASMLVRVSATAVPRGELRSAWLDKTYLDAAGRSIDHSAVRYYYAIVGGRPRLRLLEYLRLPFGQRLTAMPAFAAA